MDVFKPFLCGIFPDLDQAGIGRQVILVAEIFEIGLIL